MDTINFHVDYMAETVDIIKLWLLWLRRRFLSVAVAAAETTKSKLNEKSLLFLNSGVTLLRK